MRRGGEPGRGLGPVSEVDAGAIVNGTFNQRIWEAMSTSAAGLITSKQCVTITGIETISGRREGGNVVRYSHPKGANVQTFQYWEASYQQNGWQYRDAFRAVALA